MWDAKGKDGVRVIPATGPLVCFVPLLRNIYWEDTKSFTLCNRFSLSL